jgi:hypothetical protein
MMFVENSETNSNSELIQSGVNKIYKKNKIQKMAQVNVNDLNCVEILNENLTIDEITHDSEIKNDVMEEYKRIQKKIKNFETKTIKDINEIYNDMKKFEKNLIKINAKNNKKTIKNNDWGISEKKNIPKAIEIFFNLEPNAKLSRTIIGGLFQNYLKQNNLKGNLNAKNKIDNRIYRMDNKLATLFGLTIEHMDKINNSNSSKTNYPDGFNFYNYQTWIKQIYNETNL